MDVGSGGFEGELLEHLDIVAIELGPVGVRAIKRKTYELVTHRDRNRKRVNRRVLRIEMRTYLVEPDHAFVGKQHAYEEIVAIEARRSDRRLQRCPNTFVPVAAIRAAVESRGGQVERIDWYLK